MIDRALNCAGDCGRTLFFFDGPGDETIEVRCEECYLREFGDPSRGFVGFVDGWFRIVRRTAVPVAEGQESLL